MPQPRIEISIHESEVEKFKRFSELPLKVLKEISTEFSHHEPTLDIGPVIREISENSEHDSEDVIVCIELLWSLTFAHRRSGLALETFLDDVTADLSKKPTSIWPSKNRDRWKKRLELVSQLIGPESLLSLIAKAGELLFKQDKVLCNSKIVTDLRPIFDKHEGFEPGNLQAFVPFHNFIIEYRMQGDVKEIYFAMDSNDITKLRDRLDRALQKENILSNKVIESGMMVVKTNQEDTL